MRGSLTGVMTGTGEDTFSLNETITRQEMAVVLARSARSLGAAGDAFDLSAYADQEDISDWAADGVGLCSSLGILQGSDGKFRPRDPATRAMAAAVLARLDGLDLTEAAETQAVPEEPVPPAEEVLQEEEPAPTEGNEPSEGTEAMPND